MDLSIRVHLYHRVSRFIPSKYYIDLSVCSRNTYTFRGIFHILFYLHVHATIYNDPFYNHISSQDLYGDLIPNNIEALRNEMMMKW